VTVIADSLLWVETEQKRLRPGALCENRTRLDPARSDSELEVNRENERKSCSIAVSSISPTVTGGKWKAPAVRRERPMPSANYRYYRLDRVGHLEGAEWFKVEDDEDAIRHVTSEAPSSPPRCPERRAVRSH
jgi:hypothetical protein